MKTTDREIVKQSINLYQAGKNIIIEAQMIDKKGKKHEYKKIVPPAEQKKYESLVKKDANAFNDAVTENIASVLHLDSEAESKQECRHARTKTLQQRLAKALSVDGLATLKKTNYYLRQEKKAKKTAKKAVSKK